MTNDKWIASSFSQTFRSYRFIFFLMHGNLFHYFRSAFAVLWLIGCFKISNYLLVIDFWLGWFLVITYFLNSFFDCVFDWLFVFNSVGHLLFSGNAHMFSFRLVHLNKKIHQRLRSSTNIFHFPPKSFSRLIIQHLRKRNLSMVIN